MAHPSFWKSCLYKLWVEEWSLRVRISKRQLKMKKSNNYKLPTTDLLETNDKKISDNDADAISNAIISTVEEKGYEVRVVEIRKGPAYTRFYAKTEGKTKYKDIKELENDIALGVESLNGSVVITDPIPMTKTFAIDVPNKNRSYVWLKDFINKSHFDEKPPLLNIPLGLTNDGKYESINLSKQPHILMSGAVSGGKSSYLNSIISTFLFRTKPEDLKMILIDLKRVEFYPYRELPHLLCPVLNDPEETVKVLLWLVEEMEKRYSLFEIEKARNIDDYNEKTEGEHLPYIVLIVDEYSDAMVFDPINMERSIIQLAKLSRATGIHMILCSQRPSTALFTGLMKSEIEARICFNVVSKIDSRVILEQEGAEKLLMKGDLLYKAPFSSTLIRAQAPYISEVEIDNLTKFVSEQAKPEYNNSLITYLSQSEKFDK